MNAHSEQAPEPITTDHRHTPIREGARVAYNKSGGIMLGRIVKVVRNEWKVARTGVAPKSWWTLKFILQIEGEDGNMSYIANPLSFVIIDYASK